MKRKQFTMKAEWYEVCRELPPENQNSILLAICELALNGRKIPLEGLEKTIFSLIENDIAKSFSKAMNGKKGGISPKPQNAENQSDIQQSTKQTESKPQSKTQANNQAKIDYDALVDFFNTQCPRLPQVRQLTDKRKQLVKSVVAEFGKPKLQQAIINLGQSDFCAGHNNKNWTATFDWLLNKNNFIKVLENNYGKRTENNYGVSKPDDFDK